MLSLRSLQVCVFVDNRRGEEEEEGEKKTNKNNRCHGLMPDQLINKYLLW